MAGSKALRTHVLRFCLCELTGCMFWAKISIWNTFWTAMQNTITTKSHESYRIRSKMSYSASDDWSAPCGVLRDCIATRFSLANLLFGCPGAILGAPLAGQGRGSGGPRGDKKEVREGKNEWQCNPATRRTARTNRRLGVNQVVSPCVTA